MTWNIVTLVLTFTVVMATTVTERSSFNVTCTTDDECAMTFGAMTACVDVNVTSEGVRQMCACDHNRKFSRKPGATDDCWREVELGDPCSDDGTTVCMDPYTVCEVSGDLYHTKRCQCDLNTINVLHNQRTVCATPITSQTDATCESCEQNMGRCYDIDGDKRRDGCHCPISLTGDDCQIVHVFVNCTVADFKMTVCYDPHDGVNLTTSARMHTENYGTDVACRGVPDVDNKCEQGTHRLELPLSEEKRTRCGTRKHKSSTSLKYENRIHVDRGTGVPGDYIMFNTYCLFQTHAVTSFNGMGVFALADGWAGQDSEPEVRLTVHRAIGDELRDGMALRAGDKVTFHVSLDPAGDYGAVHVDNCMFSPSYSSYGGQGLTVSILRDGCPVPGQTYLGADNNWGLSDPSRPFEVHTGLVAPPMMRAGLTTYLHCTVRLCLRGELEGCRPTLCNLGKVTEHEGVGRRKRSQSPGVRPRRRRRETPDVSDKAAYLELTGGIRFKSAGGTPDALIVDEDDQNDSIVLDKALFAAGATITFLILLLLLTSTLVLMTREYRRGRSKIKALPPRMATSRPPLFSLARVQRS